MMVTIFSGCVTGKVDENVPAKQTQNVTTGAAQEPENKGPFPIVKAMSIS
jgi:hypothetical protein